MRKTNCLIEYIKKETVLCIAVLLAAVSSFIVLPDAGYAKYIDYRTLAIFPFYFLSIFYLLHFINQAGIPLAGYACLMKISVMEFHMTCLNSSMESTFAASLCQVFNTPMSVSP